MKCVLLAREAKDFPYKLLLLSVAQVWRVIAETSETMEARELQSCCETRAGTVSAVVSSPAMIRR